MRRAFAPVFVALALLTRALPGVAAETVAAAPVASGVAPSAPAAQPPSGSLESPDELNTRFSAYSLPARTWAFDVGALGIGEGDVFAKFGAAYGFGSGVEIETNLAHFGVGLANVTGAWHFFGSRYFDLGARIGFWYGRGKWFWIAQGPTKDIVNKIDIINFPVELTASSLVTRWLELDLAAHYGYAKAFGSFDDSSSLFVKAELAVNQFYLRPGARLFLSDRTALEVFAKLPLYSAVPLDERTVTVPFSQTWNLEAGLRSRLGGRMFGTLRLHYGSIANALYGARLYPSFDVEVRF